MTAQTADRRKLQCRECREWYDEVFFEVALGKNSYPKLRKVRCIGCRLTRRTREKEEGKRYWVKARNAVMTHAAKFIKTGVVQSAEELVTRFGWNLAAMAHDIEHAFKNGCPYCRVLFSQMPNGLGALTLDVVDPSQPPYYAVNTRWSCMTCNRSKAKTAPSVWAIKLLCWEKWRSRQAELRNRPLMGTLFDPDLM
jgi:hypothetical protein